ncbi:MAG TPA: TetR/AcrR family transcriptional regulator [Acidimicrobiales bacterium]
MSPRLPAARRRRQLLDVALQVFAERGFHDASMNDIAEAAGVTKPVLYQHFRSKRELFGELLADCGTELQDAITKAVVAAESSREMVELGFDAYFRYVAAHRDAFNLFYGIGSAREDEFVELVEGVVDALAELVAGFIEIEGIQPEQRRLLGHGIVGMIEGASTHWLKHADGADPAVVACQLADLAWRGLRGVHPGDAPVG